MSVYTRGYTERDGSEFQVYENCAIEYRDASHRYWLHHDGGRPKMDGPFTTRTPVVSVTSALKVLDKPALLSWAEAAGAEGAVRLERAGELKDVDPSQAIDVVRINKLGMDAKRDAGADRGTAMHRVLEFWAREHEVPDLDDYPAEVRGYVQGACSFLLAVQPKPTAIEMFVGSIRYGYAGRMDLRAEIDGRDLVVDYKSNPKGRVYNEAHLQGRAYAMGAVECGMPEPDGILIVAIGEDGSYEMVECEAEAGDWLNVLATHGSMKRLESARQARGKVRMAG